MNLVAMARVCSKCYDHGCCGVHHMMAAPNCGVLFFLETQYNSDIYMHEYTITPMTHTRNPTPMSIFAILSRYIILRLTKSAPRLRRERLLPLKAYYLMSWN